MEDILILTKIDLQNILSDASRAAVGKVMKRIEISQNFNQSKAEIKEVIYEEFRNVKTQLECYSRGMRHYQVELLKPNQSSTI